MAQPTSYCTTADVESIISVHGITALADDDYTFGRDGGESQLIADSISRAAVVSMNFYLTTRYDLNAISNNQWLRWANAMLAAADIAMRRLHDIPKSLKESVTEIRLQLRQINRGYMALPDEPEHYNHLPATSTLEPERFRSISPVRVNVQESTREPQPPDLQRRTARLRPYIDFQ